MKEIKFKSNFRVIKKRNRNNAFDDGALVSIRRIRNKNDRVAEGWVTTHIYFHINLLRQFNSNAVGVNLLFDRKYLGFQFVSQLGPDTYKLFQDCKTRKRIACGIASRFVVKKYFEDDVFLDKSNNIPIIKIDLEEGKTIEDIDLENKEDEGENLNEM